MIKAYSTLRKAEREPERIHILGGCLHWGTEYLIWEDWARQETNHTRLEDIPPRRRALLREEGLIR